MKHKTRTERVYNESTGWYETREVELKGYTFTDDDRILIVREYLESGVSAEKIIKKYHMSSRAVLFSWMDKFLNEKDFSCEIVAGISVFAFFKIKNLHYSLKRCNFAANYSLKRCIFFQNKSLKRCKLLKIKIYEAQDLQADA